MLIILGAMTQESIDDFSVASSTVVTCVVQAVDGQTSESLRRLIPPNLTTVRAATVLTTKSVSTENQSTPKIIVQPEDDKVSGNEKGAT